MFVRQCHHDQVQLSSLDMFQVVVHLHLAASPLDQGNCKISERGQCTINQQNKKHKKKVKIKATEGGGTSSSSPSDVESISVTVKGIKKLTSKHRPTSRTKFNGIAKLFDYHINFEL